MTQLFLSTVLDRWEQMLDPEAAREKGLVMQTNKALKKGMTAASIVPWRSKPNAESRRRTSKPPAGLDPNRSLMSLAIIE